MRQEGGTILLGCEQYEVGEALGHHGGDLPEVIGAALDVLSYEFVDVTVQAIGHRVLASLSVRSPSPISRTNEQRGWWMRTARRGWTMLEEDGRSMLALIEERIRFSGIGLEHRDLLIRLRAMIEDDLDASAQSGVPAPSSGEGDS